MNSPIYFQDTLSLYIYFFGEFCSCESQKSLGVNDISYMSNGCLRTGTTINSCWRQCQRFPALTSVVHSSGAHAIDNHILFLECYQIQFILLLHLGWIMWMLIKRLTHCCVTWDLSSKKWSPYSLLLSVSQWLRQPFLHLFYYFDLLTWFMTYI